MNGLAALDGFIRQNNISMQLSRVKGRAPAPATRDDGVEKYKCRIERGGKGINVFVAAPPEEGHPTPPDVLFMLILDASGCEMLKDYYGLHQQMPFAGKDEKSSEFDEFWKEYSSRCEQTKKLKAFLGRDLFNELIIRFGFQD